ncbi:sialidase family protein [Actinoalloteichus fjordicus]|uniref:Neuraminidase (Sialidase) n=1 Tax=Actinoalloteichus fjordicus TaxID=1612552 RepID=A0AAC9L8F0_9PSEU|nr:exo-alpha-sialidase [Actinoalloteichus fjordicus]APU12285.1 putative neuraminidase (sialidase) [Actinoalloteichus fjordicus]
MSTLRETGPGLAEAGLVAPVAQSHAANLAVLPDGDLGCVWFGGTQEGVHDIRIWFARLAQDGTTWSDPVALTDDPERSEQNPLLFHAPDDSLWLFWTAQHAGRQDTAEVRVRRSTDSGRSWDEPRVLLPADEVGGVFIRQPVQVTAEGTWLLPSFSCRAPATGTWSGGEDTSAVYASTDGGTSWSRHDIPGSRGAVHMNVLPAEDGYLALYRSRFADAIHASTSPDGVRWTKPVPTALPNNNSSVQATRLRDGRLALVYNASSAADASHRRAGLYDEVDEHGALGGRERPAVAVDRDTSGQAEDRQAFWGAPRAPIALATSADDGRSWQRHPDLAQGEGTCLTNNSRDGLNRELSYPSIVQDARGRVHVAYTRHRSSIRHVRIEPDWPGWQETR